MKDDINEMKIKIGEIDSNNEEISKKAEETYKINQKIKNYLIRNDGATLYFDKDDNVIRPAILWNDGRSSAQTIYLNKNVGCNVLAEETWADV